MENHQSWVDQNVFSLDCGISYQPLNQNDSIRLLKLHPSSDPAASTIECTLSEHSLSDCKKEYVALSYTWGDATSRREITVNGKPAYITENLHAALTHILGLKGLLSALIKESCKYYLWIDALCINQQDPAEKFVQVANMRDVFANAQWVVAWMGPAADGSDELLRDINAHSPSSDSGEQMQFPPAELQAFFSREWFSRMWILQEFMVPRMLVWFLCGHSYINEYILFGGVDAVLSYMDRASYYIVDTEFRDLLTWRMYLMLLKERLIKDKGLSMMYLIEATKDSKCTDPRDRIFALLGLLTAADRRLITTDYNSSPCEVFCNAIRIMATDADADKAARVTEIVESWKRSSFRGGEKLREHDPLQEVLPARWTCDGIACSSLSLCVGIPESAKMSGKRVVQALIMGYNNGRNQATNGEQEDAE